MVPAKTGVKPYHILRETLRRTGRVAVATVVMRGRQHLAALIADEQVITLELLRFAHEIKAVSELEAGDALRGARVSRTRRSSWPSSSSRRSTSRGQPEQFRDEYRDDLLALIEQKAKTGKTPVKRGGGGRQKGAEVVDMMELLKKSVGEAKGRKGERRRKAG